MSTHSPIQQHPRLSEDANSTTSAIHSIKPEPLSPQSIRRSSSQRGDGNPMALDKVLSNENAAGRSRSRRNSSSADDEHPNKRQKCTFSDSDEREQVTSSQTTSNGSQASRQSSQPQPRTVLPKPVHTVSSQTGPSSPVSSLLDKRQSKRKLMIFAPPPGNVTAGIRSAPLHSNFGLTMHPHQPHQQPSLRSHHHGQTPSQQTPLPLPSQQSSQQSSSQQQQVSSQSHAYPHPLKKQDHTVYSAHPKTAALLQPGHALPPLLSPGMKDAAKRRDFAVPPIVPSQQQQPPFTATHPPTATTTSSTAAPNTALAPSTAAAVAASSSNVTVTPIPPTTPSTTTFSHLQRQQFLQPFEQLFDTVESTRTLKSMLDDQIRRSSTLVQTLQASSTTIESLVRTKIKEMQKEIVSQMESSLGEIRMRIERLEKTSQRSTPVRDLPSLIPTDTPVSPTHQKPSVLPIMSSTPSPTSRRSSQEPFPSAAFDSLRRASSNTSPSRDILSTTDRLPAIQHLRDPSDRVQANKNT